MPFNSIDFSIFLPIIFLLYWFVTYRSLKFQNLLILAASYLFYSWWDWRFLFLIFFSTITNYAIGRLLHNEEKEINRKLFLWLSITVNIGFLGFFKYYNFFLENFVSAFSFFGVQIENNSLNIILPVGISFYTFQTLSYSIDVYKRKLEPTKNLIEFSAFVSFFPQLVAGPIERARNLLPQFSVKRSFDSLKATDGLKQILWGLLKKIVIADNCAEYVNLIFNNSHSHSGLTLMAGGILFTIQIYCDFSGYSDIAIGTARLFGFNLSKNFDFPLFSENIPDLWRKWHITLTSWINEAVFTPLSIILRDYNKIGLSVAVIINFIIIGIWHGANWTFIVFGFVHGCIFIPYIFNGTHRIKKKRKKSSGPRKLFNICLTFYIFMLTCIIFRAESINQAWEIISEIFSPSILSLPTSSYFRAMSLQPTLLAILIILFFLIEWLGREQEFAISDLKPLKIRPLRWTFYILIMAFIFYFGNTDDHSFIYFQF